MLKDVLLKRISLGILLIAISTISSNVDAKTGIPIGNTTIWWFINLIILYNFFRTNRTFFDTSQSKNMIVVTLYLWWNIICLIYASFVAENYWDWKALISNGMALLIPIMAFTATNPVIMQSILRYFLNYGLRLFCILAFMMIPDAYGFYLVPVSFLLIFFPVLPKKWKIIVLSITLFVVLGSLASRSTVIKFILPFLFSFVYYLRAYISINVYEWIRRLLFVAPIIFFSLAVTDNFNIFNLSDYTDSDVKLGNENGNDEVKKSSLLTDTRSSLYVEVLESAITHNYWLIGRSPARGNDSVLFGADDPSGRGERGGNEVAILNVFTWTGIVGVILYGLVFYQASYLAINLSNNIFSKIIGIFMAFRWLYAWVEDVNYFTITYAFLWLMLGMCFSKSFRAMNDQMVINWVEGVFDKRMELR